MTRKPFLKIGITRPEFSDNEAMRITMLLDNGVDFMHIRKPGADVDRIKALIEDIPERLHCRLRLHDAPELLDRYSLAGFHLNSRYPEPPAGARTLTRSCHSLEELTLPFQANPETSFVYQTLSPIYDSISKPGYRSAFSPQVIAPYIRGLRVVALGGVTEDRIDELRQTGFFGAAMLGDIWRD